MWVTFAWKDALDLLLVAGLLYAVLLRLRRTHARFLFTGISLLLVLYGAARVLNLYLTTTLFQACLAFFAIIVAVMFQRELRSVVAGLSGWARWSRARQAALPDRVADQRVETLLVLAQHKIGALIVLPGTQGIDGLVQGGVPLDGQVSRPLLLSLFDPSSPGHDGAVILAADRVVKFSVHLPLADRFDHDGPLGTRHRAALGLAERSDALVLAVSEERGTISVASDGELRTLAPSGALRADLAALLTARLPPAPVRPWPWLLTQNLRDKAIAVGLSLLLWAIVVAPQGSGVVTRPYEVPVEFQFLPQGYGVSALSPETLAVTLAGRNRDFTGLDPEVLRVVIRLPGGVTGLQRLRLQEALISHPSALSVVNFTPRYVAFTIQKQDSGGRRHTRPPRDPGGEGREADGPAPRCRSWPIWGLAVWRRGRVAASCAMGTAQVWTQASQDRETGGEMATAVAIHRAVAETSRPERPRLDCPAMRPSSRATRAAIGRGISGGWPSSKALVLVISHPGVRAREPLLERHECLAWRPVKGLGVTRDGRHAGDRPRDDRGALLGRVRLGDLPPSQRLHGDRVQGLRAESVGGLDAPGAPMQQVHARWHHACRLGTGLRMRGESGGPRADAGRGVAGPPRRALPGCMARVPPPCPRGPAPPARGECHKNIISRTS